ncbi:MAG: glycosyl hydrolase, partial [Nitrospirae bacterium]|nr:glycosyl hydrolase [Nitrospirota bacterium]
VFHCMTSQRPQDGKPGYEFGAGTHFNPNITWWQQSAGPWLSYVNRCQALLQSGLFVADVLYYNGDGAPNLVEPKHVDPSLGKGYDYDVCNAEVLLTRLSVKDGRLVLPDGMSYRMLVLPDSRRMPVEVAQKIRDLVQAGAMVVGPKPESDPGLKNYPQCDAEVKKIATEVWGACDGQQVKQQTCGKGRVLWGRTLREILLADGVLSDIEVSGASDSFIDFIHRTTAEADFYFLANRNERPEKVEATFRQSGRQPELWNPVSGEQRDLPQFTIKDGRTSVPLEFEPHGSIFIVFRKPVGKSNGSNFARLETVHKVECPWTISFDKEWFYPLDGLAGQEAEGIFVFKTLEDWSKRPEPAVKYFSGTARYKTPFEAPESLRSGKRVFLDLGTVNETARVTLNGKELGVAWCAPRRVEVTEALKPGENILEIEVVNLWPNRLIGDGKLPAPQRRTKTNIANYYNPPKTGEHALLPSGLLGTVRFLTN